MEQLTFLWEAPPVKTCLAQERDLDLKASEASSPSILSSWLTGQMPSGLSGKTFPELYRATREKILPDSYRSCADGKCQSPPKDGEKPESSLPLPDVTDWHGESLTLNIPEHPSIRGQCPNDDGVSSLSDILVVGNIPHKYYLTEKCALGILRRAERRGRELPAPLQRALEELVARSSSPPSSGAPANL